MLKKVLKFTALSVLILSVFAALFGFAMFEDYSANLPGYDKLKNYRPLITTRLYAADGTLFSEYSKEKRIFVPIDTIPKNLINAFLAAEDADFYKNPGISLMAIVRASAQNAFSLLKGEQIVGGGSTITQQVVKNFLLSNERTMQRKVKEGILAYRITKSLTKDQILELYLNQIYLGSGSYGVAAAAQIYFDKSVDELTVEECALLATLPKAPSKLDPRKNIDKAKIRRDWVIGRMVKEGFLSEADGEEAMKKPIVVVDKNYQNEIKADFFADNVKKELIAMYSSDDVFENGIVVRTTLDPKLQLLANAALQSGIEEYDRKHGYRGSLGKIDPTSEWQKELKDFAINKIYPAKWRKAVVLSVTEKAATVGVDNSEIGTIALATLTWARKQIDVDHIGPGIKKVADVLKPGDVILVERIADQYQLRQIPEVNGAFVAMDPHSGRVLAMSGGYVDAPNQFNRATQGQRQPGSTMKTFGYIAALENGMTPANIIMDEEIILNQGADLPPYTPTNYSGHFYGPTTLRIGLEKSLNVTTVRMADQIGLDKVAAVVKRFGVNDNPRKIYSLVLGSTETTLLKLVTAYSQIVNGGRKVAPSMIEKIQDRNGITIYRRDANCEDCIFTENKPENQITLPTLADKRERLTDSATAYQITYMLQGVIERGTSQKARAVGKILGGKTGTTDNSFDSWFVGFSPDLVAGVYIGFDTPKSLGEDETGASVALPVFINFMKEALKGVPSMPFRVPSTVKMVNIDRITGKLPSISTPKENFFSEAFKLKDDLDLLEKANEETISSYTPASESNAQASEGVEGAKPSGEGGAEIIKSPAGIY